MRHTQQKHSDLKKRNNTKFGYQKYFKCLCKINYTFYRLSVACCLLPLSTKKFILHNYLLPLLEKKMIDSKKKFSLESILLFSRRGNYQLFIINYWTNLLTAIISSVHFPIAIWNDSWKIHELDKKSETITTDNWNDSSSLLPNYKYFFHNQNRIAIFTE